MVRLLATASVLLAMQAPAVHAATIEVTGDPLGGLGEAIVEAAPGDTIEIPAGEYLLTEGDLLEEKGLTLVGAGANRTTVVPGGGGDALEAPGVVARGLEVGVPLQPPEAEAVREEESSTGGIETQAQIIALIVTFAIFLLVLELVRRRRLVERYALLWMTAALALLVLSIWTDGLEVIADAMGIQEPANAIFLLAFAVGFLVLLNFSVASSRLSEETKILAQEAARLDQELRLERSVRGAEQAQDDPPVAPQ